MLVSQWVFDWMSGTLQAKSKPEVWKQRVALNADTVPRGHFGVYQEVVILFSRLDVLGYVPEDHMLPDGSIGKRFCRFLREKGVDTDGLPTYPHRYPDGRTVRAKAYPNEHLADFRYYAEEVWLPRFSREYFAERDVKALPFVNKAFRLNLSLGGPTNELALAV